MVSETLRFRSGRHEKESTPRDSHLREAGDCLIIIRNLSRLLPQHEPSKPKTCPV
jgi:hypothetical protein